MNTKMIEALLPHLGQMGVDALKKEIDEVQADAKEPWKKAVLALVADGVEKFGPAGVEMAQKAISQLASGKAPKIDWADLLVASDLLAQLQNAEAKRRSEAKAYVAKVGQVAGTLLGGMIKGLLKSA